MRYHTNKGAYLRIGWVKSGLFLLTLLLSAGYATTFLPQKSFVIAGRAVDGRGIPFSRAEITLYYPPCKNCIDQILPGASSLPDGVFFLEFNGTSKKGLKLFVEEATPAGFWSPFGSPPFEKLSHLRAFQGVPLYPRKNASRMDLGDVQVRIRYSRVRLQLPEEWREKYESNAAPLGSLKLTLSDLKGGTVYNGRLPKAALDPSLSSVNLALVKGNWMLELSLYNGNQRIRSQRRKVEVKNSNDIRITLN